VAPGTAVLVGLAVDKKRYGTKLLHSNLFEQVQ
jgi:hypothetical protein